MYLKSNNNSLNPQWVKKGSLLRRDASLDNPVLQTGLDIELCHLDLQNELAHHLLWDVGRGEAVEVHQATEGRRDEGAAPGKTHLQVIN